MPAEPRLQCLECQGATRPLSHERWKCEACDRGGVYSVAVVDGREIAVRMVTRWRDAEGKVRHG